MRARTMRFAGSAVRFFISLDKRREELRVLGKQLLRAGTSVGANYREASRARSDNEFIAKIDQCSQEANETQYWLEIIRDDCGINDAEVKAIWNEADELIRIFVAMSKNTKKRREETKSET